MTDLSRQGALAQDLIAQIKAEKSESSSLSEHEYSQMLANENIPPPPVQSPPLPLLSPSLQLHHRGPSVEVQSVPLSMKALRAYEAPLNLLHENELGGWKEKKILSRSVFGGPEEEVGRLAEEIKDLQLAHENWQRRERAKRQDSVANKLSTLQAQLQGLDQSSGAGESKVRPSQF